MADQSSFIPDKKSAWFTLVFDLYCRSLFKRRFSRIEIKQDYHPSHGRKTIYYLNHNSWWDGLIPFYLDRKLFKQEARGMMEQKQLERYPFFRKLGVFSIDPQNPRSTVRAMRYSAELLKKPDAALYIYPEGKLVPFTGDIKPFKQGLGWLAKQCPDADLVPIAIYIHTMKSDKPELQIRIGKPANTDRTADAPVITGELEKELAGLLRGMVSEN